MKIKEIHLFIKGAERAFPGRFRPCGGNHRELCFRMNALHMARDQGSREAGGPRPPHTRYVPGKQPRGTQEEDWVLRL